MSKRVEQIKAGLAFKEYPNANFMLQGYELKFLFERIEKLEGALKWIMPKVHQGNHNGDLETCEKATCYEYRKALSRGSQCQNHAPRSE